MLLTFRMQLIVFIILYRINLGKRSCVVASGEVAYIMRLQQLIQLRRSDGNDIVAIFAKGILIGMCIDSLLDVLVYY